MLYLFTASKVSYRLLFPDDSVSVSRLPLRPLFLIIYIFPRQANQTALERPCDENPAETLWWIGVFAPQLMRQEPTRG